MGKLDDFFKANYLRMVRYCSSRGFVVQDAEEEVADAILKHYDEYLERIEHPNPDAVARQWINRRVLWNLKTRVRLMYYSKREELDDETAGLTFDDPESILSVKQRLPKLHPILLHYESHGGDVGPRSANTNSDRTSFCRERKKFMDKLMSDKIESKPSVELSSTSKSGYVGVRWKESNKRWAAEVYVSGVSRHIGHFKTLEEAVAARKSAVARFAAETENA